MLSKSLGQILSLHVLFHYFSSEQSQEPLPDIITDEAVKAAMNFVEVCCQQTAFIAGRGGVEGEIAVIKTHIQVHVQNINLDSYYMYIKRFPIQKLLLSKHLFPLKHFALIYLEKNYTCPAFFMLKSFETGETKMGL